MKKVTRTDLGIDLKGMPEEQRTFMEKMCDIMCETVNKAMEGGVSSTDIDAKFKSINDEISKTLKGYDNEKFAQIIKDNEELREVVKSLTENLEKAKQKGFGLDRFSKLDESLDAMFESEKYKSFVAGTTKDARGFQLKDVVSMTNNYSGSVLISAQDQVPRTQIRDKKTHVRDYATVLQGDPEMTAMTWPIIYDMDRNARYVSENGELPESSFKIKEESVSVKRIGHTFPMSKRMLKSRIFVRSFILNKAVQGVLDSEDAGLLFGDGGGDMVKGVTAYDGVRAIEDIITENIITGAAGSVKAITEVGNGLLVELQSPHDLLMEGLKVTFSGATTNTNLNNTYDVIKFNDTTLLLEGATLAATNTPTLLAADVAALTYVVNNSGFKSVESPNSVDALETGVAVMTFGQFTPSVMLLNPITLNSIRTEKATDGNRLKLVENMGDTPVIGGVRVIPTTNIAPGKYLMGDFVEGATIVDYTGLELDWAEDVDTKKRNMIVLIVQEELLFPVYCPWAFAYGNINALKAAIAKD